MEARLRVLSLTVMTGAIACVTVEPVVITDRAVVSGTRLELAATQGGCALRSGEAADVVELPLQPSPPCYFSRRGQASPQTFGYADEGVQATLIVIGTPLLPADRMQWDIPPSEYCGSKSQGILVRDNIVEISGKPALDGVFCKDKGADEKDFWYFAH